MTPWKLLCETAEACQVNLSADQIAEFQRYYQLLLDGNETCNLTRITTERDVVVKHFVDSLFTLKGIPLSWLDRGVRLLDVGSGAGFPGLPVLLSCPLWQGVLLEATRKKAEFLANSIAELGLGGRAEAHWGRAEEAPKAELESYDLVVARAVANLGNLASWTMPLVKPGGRAVFLKGPLGQTEATQASQTIELAGGREPKVIEADLPEGAGKRILVVIEKQ